MKIIRLKLCRNSEVLKSFSQITTETTIQNLGGTCSADIFKCLSRRHCCYLRRFSALLLMQCKWTQWEDSHRQRRPSHNAVWLLSSGKEHQTGTARPSVRPPALAKIRNFQTAGARASACAPRSSLVRSLQWNSNGSRAGLRRDVVEGAAGGCTRGHRHREVQVGRRAGQAVRRRGHRRRFHAGKCPWRRQTPSLSEHVSALRALCCFAARRDQLRDPFLYTPRLATRSRCLVSLTAPHSRRRSKLS